MFGWLAGAITTIFAATTGATIIFLAARTSLEKVLARNAGPLLNKIRTGFARDAFNYLFFLRLVPLFPFWLVNIASALAHLRLKTFVSATFLGIIPVTTALSFVGASFDSVIDAQKAAHETCLAQGGSANCPFDFSRWPPVNPANFDRPRSARHFGAPPHRPEALAGQAMIYDLAVIGAGSGGLSVAAAAAQFGRRVILFEKGRMGGDCLNYGCVPSKALIAAAKHAHAFRTAGKYGISAAEPKVDFKKVHAHIRMSIAAIEPNDSAARFEKLGVKVVLSAARFRDAKTVETSEDVFAARRFVIATGSRPAVPAIPGLETVPYFTNETIFENNVLPRHLIIIGGGSIGVELAQAYRRLGSQVTVIEASAPLSKEDPELTAIVLECLREDGVKILSSCCH